MNQTAFSTISFPQRSKRKPDATVYIDCARAWCPGYRAALHFDSINLCSDCGVVNMQLIPHAILGSWSASTSIRCGASTNTSRRLLKSCRILYGLGLATWPGQTIHRFFTHGIFSWKERNGMQGKETCGGMKMRNESQVGFNQNYQPKKWQLRKKRMHLEREKDGTSKKIMYHQYARNCDRIRENSKIP